MKGRQSTAGSPVIPGPAWRRQGDRRRPWGWLGMAGWALAGWMALAVPAWAQLSSPMPPGYDPLLPGSIDPPAGDDARAGSGPGYHSPDSLIPPLQDKEGVLSWAVLSSVKVREEPTRVRPLFSPELRALHGRTVRVQGFMMPLDTAPRQRHFLLSAVPTSCPFCIPAGPEGMVEVKARAGVRYGIEPVIVEGRLTLLDNDEYGLFYRLTEAVPVSD